MSVEAGGQGGHIFWGNARTCGRIGHGADQLHDGFARGHGIAVGGAGAFGIGRQFGGRVGTIEGFFAPTGTDMELTGLVGKEIMSFPFCPQFLVER